MSKVKENDVVKVHFTGKLDNGQVFDTSTGKEPLKVALGQGNLIPGFEKGLIDMEVNEKKTIRIEKEEAFGEVRNELFQKVPKTQLPPEVKPEVGMTLMGSKADGSQQQFRVAEVGDEAIIVDGNHPLAGHNLIFDLELVEIL
jgi:FKBP-type peptidyl-prolyl cis-trans isomerase 2